jgi:surface polysaccharide O-acyltransferase-like enzyme
MGELLMGRAGPHLYFVIIILQFYLLYPLLKKAVDRAPTLSLLVSFLSTLLLQGSHYLRFIGVTTASPASRFWITAPFWAFYFVAGMWLQKRPVETIKSKCKRFALILTALTLAFALLYSLSAAHTGFLDSINPALMLYVPLVFFCGIALWSVMEKVPFAPKVVSFLSAHSMGIYYNHVLLLCFFRTFPRLVNGLSGMLLLFLATTLSAIALACALRRLKGLLLKTAF